MRVPHASNALRLLLENGLALAVAALPPGLLLASGRLVSCGLRGAVAQAGAIAVASLVMTDAKDEWGSVISTVRGFLGFLLFPGLFLRLPSSLLSASPTLLDPSSFDQVSQLDVVVHGIVYVILARLACQSLEKNRLCDRFVLQLCCAKEGAPAGFARLAPCGGDDDGSKLQWSHVRDMAMATALTGRRSHDMRWKLSLNGNALQSFCGAVRFEPSSEREARDATENGTSFSVGEDALYTASWGRNQFADATPMQATEHRGGEVYFFGAGDGCMYMVPRTHSCGDATIAWPELPKKCLKVVAIPVRSV